MRSARLRRSVRRHLPGTGAADIAAQRAISVSPGVRRVPLRGWLGSLLSYGSAARPGCRRGGRDRRARRVSDLSGARHSAGPLFSENLVDGDSTRRSSPANAACAHPIGWRHRAITAECDRRISLRRAAVHLRWSAPCRSRRAVQRRAGSARGHPAAVCIPSERRRGRHFASAVGFDAQTPNRRPLDVAITLILSLPMCFGETASRDDP